MANPSNWLFGTYLKLAFMRFRNIIPHPGNPVKEIFIELFLLTQIFTLRLTVPGYWHTASHAFIAPIDEDKRLPANAEIEAKESDEAAQVSGFSRGGK
jgi:hypothetical protein